LAHRSGRFRNWPIGPAYGLPVCQAASRLPDATGLAHERPWTEENRVAAIDGFLTQARKTLTPFNVFLAADIFGYVCWNVDDTRIGQKLEI
jgi:hypothetical protein